MVACVGAVVLLVLSLATSIVAGAISGAITDPNTTFEQDMAAPMTAEDYRLGLVVILHIGIGTVVGIWALTQGIFAVALRRGRGYGIAAIIISVVDPVLSLVTFLVISNTVLASRM